MKAHHPRTNSIERDDLIAHGEVYYNREKRTEALHWIATHPKGFSLVAKINFLFLPLKMNRPIHISISGTLH